MSMMDPSADATSRPAPPTFEFSVPEVVRLATMDDLDALSAELDTIDLTLADLDAPATEAAAAAPAPTGFGQSSPSSS